MSAPTVDATLSMEVTSVADLRLLARLLNDLKVPDSVKFEDPHSIIIDLPIKEWSLEHPSTLNLSLETS